MAIIYNIS